MNLNRIFEANRDIFKNVWINKIDRVYYAICHNDIVLIFSNNSFTRKNECFLYLRGNFETQQDIELHGYWL